MSSFLFLHYGNLKIHAYAVLVEFSESALGRFLQAVELYILTLFVLISAFYKMPVRASVVAELVRRRLNGNTFDRQGLNAGDRESGFSMAGRPDVSTNNNVAGGQLVPPNDNSLESMSQRLSTTSKISSWLIRRTSNRASVEGDRNRLWTQGEAEKGQSIRTESQRNSVEQQTPMEPKETVTWKDPALTSVVIETDPGANPSRIPPPVSVPQISDNRFTLQTNYSLAPSAYSNSSAIPQDGSLRPRPLSQDTTSSPIFGLDGVIRPRRAGESQSNRRASDTSTLRSIGMDSLLRQQQELDRSLAGLRSFSSTRRPSRVMSLVSDFSLSNFPEPPIRANPTEPTSPLTIKPDSDPSRPAAVETTKDDSFMVDDITFQLVPPQMPMVDEEQVGRDSTESSVLPRGMRLDSQGTQYDVTSFIGGK